MTDDNASFSTTCQSMNEHLVSLYSIKCKYMQSMKDHFIFPLKQFDNDIQMTEKLKLKYKIGKMEYDIAENKLLKSNNSGSKDESEIITLTQKKQLAFNNLKELRYEFKLSVNNLQNKKNKELLNNVEKYWMDYVKCVQTQNEMENWDDDINIVYEKDDNENQKQIKIMENEELPLQSFPYVSVNEDETKIQKDSHNEIVEEMMKSSM
eukprot:77093_1